MDMNEVLIFARVVEAGSFTAAGRALDLPKSTVSRKVAALEERLGVRLLERSTRRLRMTEAGKVLFERARRISLALNEAEAAVAELQAEPKGTLRLTAPVDFGQAWLAPIIASFNAAYPDVRVDIELTGRVVDMLAEGFDVALRAGTLVDSSLVARRLGTTRLGLYCGPGYLARRGAPATPEELVDHDVILFRGPRFDARWVLTSADQRREIKVDSRVSANDFIMVRGLATANMGIALLPDVVGAVEVAAGTLVPVLPQWCLGTGQLSAVYPSARHLSATVRAFLDHLKDAFSPPPWLDLDARREDGGG
jgi:DNA-binding transcriptional LysR family regulator